MTRALDIKPTRASARRSARVFSSIHRSIETRSRARAAVARRHILARTLARRSDDDDDRRPVPRRGLRQGGDDRASRRDRRRARAIRRRQGFRAVSVRVRRARGHRRDRARAHDDEERRRVERWGLGERAFGSIDATGVFFIRPAVVSRIGRRRPSRASPVESMGWMRRRRARASPRGRPPREARSVTRARDETREGVEERRRALVDVETNERVARAMGRGPTSRPTSRAGDRTARSTAGGLR